MPDPASIDAIRAAVETLLPATDGRPGGAGLEVERHVVEEVEAFTDGMVDFLATLLNAYAASVRPGASFAELSSDERSAVIREMYADEAQDIREAISTIYVFALGGMYSEWNAREPGSSDVRERPAMWDDVGYPGPSLGYPHYRQDA